MQNSSIELLMANPRGFCAGVDRAIDIVDAAIEKFGKPIYVRHEVVHNRYVVENLKNKGAIFVDEIAEVPDNSIVIFSAHGVSQAVRDEAAARDLTMVLDATCPLVTKVHMEVQRYAKKGFDVVLIGHAGHAEVEGTLGQYLNGQGKIYLVQNEQEAQDLVVDSLKDLAYVTQTTLSVDETKDIIAALKVKFPEIHGPKKDDICYATQNRQDAVRVLAKKCDVVLVVGSTNSSNSNRLRELAEQNGIEAYLLDDPNMLKANWLENAKVVGITAGASAPEILVKQVVDAIKAQFTISNMSEVTGIVENMTFSLPKILRDYKKETLNA